MSGEAPDSGTDPPPYPPPARHDPDASIHVFISYASQDAAVADALVGALERHGVGCWIAPRDVKAGALYADAIVRAIGSAKAFVLVLSESAIASSHVGREVERASSKKRPIIALRMDDAPLTPALEYFLGESQWLKAQTGSMEGAYAKLIEAIRDPTRTAPPSILSAVPPELSAARARAAKAYQVDDLLVDVGQQRVTRAGTDLPLSHLSFELLVTLAHAAPDLVSFDELAERVWPGLVITPETISQRVKLVRDALGDDPHAPRYIGGVRGRGYRIVGSVRPLTDRRCSLEANPRTAVAVLPFANLTGDATKDYLGDGMAEELISTLIRVQGLKVPARTSTFAYKGRNTDIRQIARDLGVGSILEGSVRAAGQRIRITAHLIDARDGLHLWSETYDEEFTDIFKLHDKLATEITTALQPNLLAVAEAVVAQGPPTQDVEAYNLYLQGASLLQRPNERNAAKSIEYFQQALARDPKFARAFAMIAQAQLILDFQTNSTGHLTAAERAARQALAIDPNLATAHMALAINAAVRLQFLEMEGHRRATVSLAPNDGAIRARSSVMIAAGGHAKQALEEAEKAYALAPANPVVVVYLAFQHAWSGHPVEAAKYASAAVDLGYPTDSWPLTITSELMALRAARYTDAADIATKGLDTGDPNQARIVEAVRLVYAALADPGRRNTALATGARLYRTSDDAAVAGAARSDVGLWIMCSYYYALMGANDVAYGLFNMFLDGWAPGEALTSVASVSHLLVFSPELRAFRQDPRFQALETRLGLMEYWQQFGPPDDCDLKDGKLTCH
jgi:TolB-like protein